MKKISLVLITFILTIVLSAFTIISIQNLQNSNQTEPTTPPVTESTNQNPANLDESDQEFNIVMDNYLFSETELVVKSGEQIVINLTSKDGNHDFVIDELDVHSEHLTAGESQELIFTIYEEHIGKSYEFYCSVGNHRQLGQVGTITIVE